MKQIFCLLCMVFAIFPNLAMARILPWYDDTTKSYTACYADEYNTMTFDNTNIAIASTKCIENGPNCSWEESELVAFCYPDPPRDGKFCYQYRDDATCNAEHGCWWDTKNSHCDATIYSVKWGDIEWDSDADLVGNCGSVPGFYFYENPDPRYYLCLPCPSGYYCEQCSESDIENNWCSTEKKACPWYRPNSLPYAKSESECFAWGTATDPGPNGCIGSATNQDCLARCANVTTEQDCNSMGGCFWVDDYCSETDPYYYSEPGQTTQTRCLSGYKAYVHASGEKDCYKILEVTEGGTDGFNCEAHCPNAPYGVKSCTMTFYQTDTSKPAKCEYSEDSCPDGYEFENGECKTCAEIYGDNKHYWHDGECKECYVSGYYGVATSDGFSCRYPCTIDTINGATSVYVADGNPGLVLSQCLQGTNYTPMIFNRGCSAAACKSGWGRKWYVDPGNDQHLKNSCDNGNDMDFSERYYKCQYCPKLTPYDTFFSPGGSGECQKCNNGKSANDGAECQCDATYFKESGLATDANCAKCPAGYKCEGGTTGGKSPCNNGYYQNESGKAECRKCEDWNGANKDKAYCPNEGATGLTKPKFCSSFQIPNKDRNECNSCTWNEGDCRSGYYKCAGDSECKPAPAGYYTVYDTNGQGSLKPCPMGGLTDGGAYSIQQCYLGGPNMTFTDSYKSYKLPVKVYYWSM